MNKMDSLVCHIKITNEVLQNNARLVIYGYENRKSDSALKGIDYGYENRKSDSALKGIDYGYE